MELVVFLVFSGSGLLLPCQNGVWVQEGKTGVLLSASVDVNTLLYPGYYIIAYNNPNAPPLLNGSAIIEVISSTYLNGTVQKAYGTYNNTVGTTWTRTYSTSPGGWTPWVVTSGAPLYPADLNTLFATGTYGSGNSLTANSPPLSWYVVEVVGITSINVTQSAVKQRAIGTNGSEKGITYERTYSSATWVGWTPWVRADRGFVGFSGSIAYISLAYGWQYVNSFNNITLNTCNCFAGNGLVTAPYSGMYYFTFSPGMFTTQLSTTSPFAMRFNVNGVPVVSSGGVTAPYTMTLTPTLSHVIYMNTGDILSIQVFSPAAMTWGSGSAGEPDAGLFFSGFYIGS